ncbi:hypothetical protein BpHYR1_016450 [Brachionus plicatilis]|uniref:Uncharacterized protein n=1 Tax=Brachionus plicatilis TaxID=10195 RepID=A0A3M7PN54_BRAPC|nr:hypothetical protein BpHYR1_016450 [Brachionus plicatilis]
MASTVQQGTPELVILQLSASWFTTARHAPTSSRTGPQLFKNIYLKIAYLKNCQLGVKVGRLRAPLLGDSSLPQHLYYYYYY